MKKLCILTVSCAVIGLSCSKNPENEVEPEGQGTTPIGFELVQRDSLVQGSYLKVSIGDTSESAYTSIQKINDSLDIYLNIVGDDYGTLSDVKDKLALYTTIFTDIVEGSENGLQLTFENDILKSIYTNNGSQYNKWPKHYEDSKAVKIGDPINALYETFIGISKDNAYAPLFERISLRSKNLSKAYDPAMSESPQWYFGYLIGTNELKVVYVHIENKAVQSLVVELYSKPNP